MGTKFKMYNGHSISSLDDIGKLADIIDFRRTNGYFESEVPHA